MTFPLLSNCKIHAERTSINNLVIESIILLVLDPFVISSKLEVPLHFRQSYFWAILFSDHKSATDNQNNVTKPNAEKSFVQEGEYSILFSYFEAVTRWKRERSEVQVCRIIKVSLFFFFFHQYYLLLSIPTREGMLNDKIQDRRSLLQMITYFSTSGATIIACWF